MKRFGTSLFSAILISTLAACAPDDGEVDEALDTVDEVASNPLNLAFVTLRPDPRPGYRGGGDDHQRARRTSATGSA